MTEHDTSASRRVAVRVQRDYQRGRLEAPFRPAEHYPELDRVQTGSGHNSTYAAVRKLLQMWSAGSMGGSDLSVPSLAACIQPGMRVAVKPNLVLHTHPLGDEALRATVVDAAVIRPVLDYIAQALHGDGRITVADSPIRMTDFNAVVRWTGLDRVLDDVQSTWGIDVELVDIRDQTVADAASFAHDLKVRQLPGDPRGGLRIDMGSHSSLEEFGPLISRLRSTAAVGRNEAAEQHAPGRHVYEMSRSVLDADFIVSMPKLKTHKKAGMTCAMKNYVGSVIRKEWLPHHRHGPPSAGGDEFGDEISPRLKFRERAKDLHTQSRLGRWVLTPAKWIYRNTIQGTRFDVLNHPAQIKMIGGGWSGNDTCWRMVHDLYRAVLYAGGDGRLASRPIRRQLAIVDGLVAGEGDGPLMPNPRKAGILLMGMDAAWVDYFATLLMGYSPGSIPLIARALDRTAALPLTLLDRSDIDLRCVPNDVAELLHRDRPEPDAFVPPLGWARHLCDEAMYARAEAMQSSSAFDY